MPSGAPALSRPCLAIRPGNYPSGVGAAAEAEDEDVVAWTVIVDQPLVGLGDIVIQPLAERSPDEAIHAGVVIDELDDAVAVLGSAEGLEPPDVGVVADSIPSAVKKDS